MAALNTIDQSWLTHVHPNDPRNHCAQSLYPFSLEFMKWGIGKTFLKESIWRIKIYFVDGQANFTTTITTERINTRLVSHNWITRDKRRWQRLVSKEMNFPKLSCSAMFEIGVKIMAYFPANVLIQKFKSKLTKCVSHNPKRVTSPEVTCEDPLLKS